MTKRNIIIASIIIALLAINVALKPYFRQRDVHNTIKAVLNHWQNGDLTLAMSYWENEIETPPIYNLESFTVGEINIIKKNDVYSAQVPVILNFPPGNLFPSKKQWIFSMNKTRYGWKIKSFHLTEK